MARIWNKHKQINASLKPHISLLPQYHGKAGYGARRGRQKVFVGMSGGVDSSVTALLLKEKGYEVIGAFIKGWDGLAINDGLKFRDQCRWRDDQRDAIRVAAGLKIPFITYDFTKDYGEHVVEYFFKESEAGRTPNPDIMCNKEIKFKIFLAQAIRDGADYMATGHYARISYNNGVYKLLAGSDESKDQSYFLYTLGQRELAKTLFPLGELKKSEVRALALKHGLVTACKPDSQGICFIGDISIVDFLKARIPTNIGAVITVDGRAIGEHDGVPYYTIGQRHGLRLSSRLPYYIVEKDIVNNVIRVAEGNDDDTLYKKMVTAISLSWVESAPRVGSQLTAKIRYRQPPQPLTIAGAANNSID